MGFEIFLIKSIYILVEQLVTIYFLQGSEYQGYLEKLICSFYSR